MMLYALDDSQRWNEVTRLETHALVPEEGSAQVLVSVGRTPGGHLWRWLAGHVTDELLACEHYRQRYPGLLDAWDVTYVDGTGPPLYQEADRIATRTGRVLWQKMMENPDRFRGAEYSGTLEDVFDMTQQLLDGRFGFR